MRNLLWILLTLCCMAQASEPTLIYLTRHAEKVDQSSDADLSQEGQARARNLALFFKNIKLDGLFASQYQRTHKTLAPLAELKKLEIQTRRIDEGAKLCEELRQRPGTFLIAGHSNTLPELIKTLGVPGATLDEASYGDLFLLVLTGNTVTLQHFQLQR